MSERLSITDFITDGSFLRLCELLGELTGTPLSVHDADGALLEAGALGRRDDRDQASAMARVLAGQAGEDGEARLSTPLIVDGAAIGHIQHQVASDASGADRVESAARLLALTVSEACQREIEQRRRAEELQALYRLSSLLVGVGSIESVLEAGVKSAVQLLGVDAGVVALRGDETELHIRACIGCGDCLGSETGAVQLGHPALTRAYGGGTVSLDDLDADDRARVAADLKAQGLASMAAAGLMFRGEALGALAIYTREERTLSRGEMGLLESIAQQLAAAVASRRLLDVERESQRVAGQLKLAADVQRRMLPATAPTTPGVDVAARYTPCFALGGDFYDLFELGGHLGIAVGDVVGKGFPAAMLMAHVRASLRAHANDLYDLDEVISLTNKAVCRDTLINEFATLFYGVIDPKTLRMTYCNAGHEPPLVVTRPADGSPPTLANISELSTGGMVVGVDPGQRYQRGVFDLQPGDVVLAYTDGLADAMNFDNERFGKPRIRRALLDAVVLEQEISAKRIAQHVHWEMRRFAGLNTRTDDTTIVAMKIEAPGEGSSS